MNTKQILIGGAPCSGKTYFAKKLSKKLKIPWISTDIIRGMMKQIVSTKKYKDLFIARDETALQYYKNKTAQQILLEQNTESKDVFKGVVGLIKSNYLWDYYIVEGVAITPELVKKYFFRNKDIKKIFIVNHNKDVIRKIIYKRGLFDEASLYSDKVKELEVEWVMEANKWFEQQAKKHRMKTFNISDMKFDVDVRHVQEILEI